MRYWPALILFAAFGCTDSPSAPVTTQTPPAPQISYPTNDGEVVVVVIGDGREIIAPPGSASEGSKWVEYTVTYTNKSQHPVWVTGYMETAPFSGIETRADDTREWHDYGLGYCGTGSQAFQIPPNGSYPFTAALPEKYIGQEFRVLVPYRIAQNSDQWIQAASQARKVERPVGE